MPIKTFQLDSGVTQTLCVFAGVLTVISALYIAKWGLAHTAALQADTIEIAELAADLAPADPQTHTTLASVFEKTFTAEDLNRAVKEFETATALSPNNYLLWLSLGRARERNGDQKGAELALRKALAMAPNYSRVQWALGNVLLRQGKNDEAFAEIRKAVGGDASFTNAAATTAWEILDGDIVAVRNAIGDSPRANAALATLLTGQKRFDDAFDIWDRLPAVDRNTKLKETGQVLYRQFLEAGKYRLAARVGEQTGISSNGRETIGEVLNGDFEEALAARGANEFTWQIAEGISPRIGPTEGQKHSGNYSLLMSFGQGAKSIRQLSQTIAVEPGQRYVLEFFVRSDLKTAAKIKWEIVSAADGKVLAATDALGPAPDWTSVRLTFAMPPDMDGISIRLTAENCDPVNCSISGNIWFDDFSLRPDTQ